MTPATSTLRSAGVTAWIRPAALPSVVTAMVTCAVGVSSAIHPHQVVHDVALFGHLACLVVGFGGVLAVDWVALLWTCRRRTFDDVLAAARNAHILVWAGYVGLVTTGVLLEPDLGSTLTRVKVALVFVIGWNGSLAMAIHGHLSDSGNPPGRLLMVVGGLAAGLSQFGWWGATAVGFVNAH